MLRLSRSALFVFNKVLKSNFSTFFDNNKYRALQNVFITKALYCSAPSAPEDKKPTSVLKNIMGKEEQVNPKPDNEETKKTLEDGWKTMKTTLIIFGVTFTLVGSYLIYNLGSPRINEKGDIVEDDYSRMPKVPQYFWRTVNELNYYKKLINEPSREKLLPDPVSYPYYQPPYTLVLELTDVLVHPDWTYNTGWRFKKRPGIDKFLEDLHGLYEIVVYTAELGMTVFPIIESLDPKNMIMYKLCRDCTHFSDGIHVKDLSRLNRDLNKVIVVDWNAETTKFHQDNLFQVKKWNGDIEDTTLEDLTSFLTVVAHSEIKDVREVLRYYKQFDDPLETFKAKQRELASQMENDQKNQHQKQKSPKKIKIKTSPEVL